MVHPSLHFSDWAPVEIERLRARADALELALMQYHEAAAAPPHPSDAGRELKALWTKTPTPSRVRASSSRRRKIGKYDGLVEAFTEANRVLTIDDMVRIAAERGVEIGRHVLRSLVFNQKKAGRAVPEKDGYRWRSLQTETASAPSGENAVTS